MINSATSRSDAQALSASRGWLMIGGILSIVVGFILLRCIGSSVAISTLILAGYLAAEALVAIFGAMKLLGNAGWVWTLINGLASLVLGLMV